jgi:PilZ domain-containing protein
MSETEGRNPHGSSEATSNEHRQSERRLHSRFPFTVSVEAIEPQSQAKLSARTSDVGLGGCYVDTLNPFAVGTVIKIRLTKDEVTLEADAKVIFSQVGMGMGVAFISAVPRQFRIFQQWLNELTGESLQVSELPERTETDAVVTNSTKNLDFVLRELLIALMTKGVLCRAEGEAMLFKLHRYATK